MFAFGFLGLVFGAYLIDCAIQGRPPIDTLKEMLRNPGDVQGVLARNTGVIQPSFYIDDSAGSSESASEGTDSLTDASFNTGTSSDNTPLASGKIGTVISYAKAQLGKPYKWGGVGPNSYDCSGLTIMAYKKIGINIGRTTYQQVLHGTAVTKANLIPGDLVFPEPGHVQIYLGGGKIIEAPRTGLNVRITPIGRVWKARRIVKAGS